jgi:hypothetical protein
MKTFGNRPANPYQFMRLRLLDSSPAAVFRWLCGGGRRIRTSEVVRRQIYSLFPLAARESLQGESYSVLCGAGDGTRTRNLLITSQLLYQLSYASATRQLTLNRNCLFKEKLRPSQVFFYRTKNKMRHPERDGASSHCTSSGYAAAKAGKSVCFIFLNAPSSICLTRSREMEKWPAIS